MDDDARAPDLLFPPGDDVGPDPRTDPNAQALYRDMRGARSQARATERTQETLDEEGRLSAGRLPEWDEVRRAGLAILTGHARDVEVAVWLTEAEVRGGGHEGLARAAAAMAAMVRAHGTALHPQPEEADDDTFGALAGLNGVGRDGTLIQPLRLLPLVPGRDYGTTTLWDVASGGRVAAVQSAMAEAGPAAMRAHLDRVQAARDAFADLDAALTELRGGDAPPFASILDILDDTARTIRRLASVEDAPVEEAAEDVPAEPGAAPAAPRPGRIESREDAFRALTEVAGYFRRTEPHSPMSHTLETLVRRGRMDFMTLLAELIPDESTRQQVMTTAGIKQVEERPDAADS